MERSESVRSLLELIPHLEVAHHIKGRIRLRLLPSGFKLAKNSNIGDFVNSIPGVLAVRVNTVAKSVVLEYDPEVLTSSVWKDLENIRESPELSNKVAAQLQSLLQQ
jgi:hypothetical protein